MTLQPLDLVIVALYMIISVQVGVMFRKRAMKRLDAYYLADRGVSWWMVGLSGRVCSITKCKLQSHVPRAKLTCQRREHGVRV